MKTDKDWADALREQCFPEEVTPSPGSWAGISGKMHRRTVRRWSVAAALALLVPAGGLLLFGPSRAVPNSVIALEQPVLAPRPELLASLPPAGRVVPLRSGTAPRSAPETPAVPASAPVSEPVFVPSSTSEDYSVPAETEEVQAIVPETAVREEYPEEWFLEESAAEPARKKRLSITLQAGSAAGQRDAYPQQEFAKKMSLQTKAANLYWNNWLNSPQPQQMHFRHDFPLSVGLNLRWNLLPRLAMESGINYTYLHSYEEQLGHQQLHFVGIPLKLDVRLLQAGAVELGAGAYGMAEKCLYAVQGGIRYPEPTLQWSCGLFVDAGIRLGSFATLYVQPSLSYYFTKTVLMTYRTENPLSFTLQAGFRFNL